MAGTPLQSANAGGVDAFIARLDPNGAKLLYSTYYGGSGDEYTQGGSADSKGNLVLVGFTSSSNFKTAGSPFQFVVRGLDRRIRPEAQPDGTAVPLRFVPRRQRLRSGQRAGVRLQRQHLRHRLHQVDKSEDDRGRNRRRPHAAVATPLPPKIDPTGATLGFLTYLGGGQDDVGRGIAVAPDGSSVLGLRRHAVDPIFSGNPQCDSENQCRWDDAFYARLQFQRRAASRDLLRGREKIREARSSTSMADPTSRVSSPPRNTTARARPRRHGRRSYGAADRGATIAFENWYGGFNIDFSVPGLVVVFKPDGTFQYLDNQHCTALFP